MTNNKFQIVGKVQNGRVTVYVASENRIAGYSQRIKPAKKEEAVVQQVIEQTPKKAESTYQMIDSPFIKMVNDNHKRIQQEKQERFEQLAKKARRERIKQRIFNLFS